MTDKNQIVTKTDLVREIAKTLSEGKEITIRAETLLNKHVDIAFIVTDLKKPLDRQSAMQLVSAREVNRFGPDQAYTEALAKCRHRLNGAGL